MKTIWRLLLLSIMLHVMVIVFITAGITFLNKIEKNTRPQPPKAETVEEVIETDTIVELTKENLYQEIVKQDFKFPKVVMAQFILESGHLTSFLTAENNNISGMKHPKVRETTATKEQNGYAYFETWQDCVKDRRLWESEKVRSFDKDEYLSFLGDVYAEDPNYISKITSIEKTIEY